MVVLWREFCVHVPLHPTHDGEAEIFAGGRGIGDDFSVTKQTFFKKEPPYYSYFQPQFFIKKNKKDLYVEAKSEMMKILRGKEGRTI